mmetsp:Transcript_87788/g.272874  ORF Transcript_87788/g.272874 Transcript_87788/m.272874 type:complete len:201 (-) Transcript_87788:58-660(-)
MPPGTARPRPPGRSSARGRPAPPRSRGGTPAIRRRRRACLQRSGQRRPLAACPPGIAAGLRCPLPAARRPRGTQPCWRRRAPASAPSSAWRCRPGPETGDGPPSGEAAPSAPSPSASSSSSAVPSSSEGASPPGVPAPPPPGSPAGGRDQGCVCRSRCLKSRLRASASLCVAAAFVELMSSLHMFRILSASAKSSSSTVP